MSKKSARAIFSAVIIFGALTLLISMTVRDGAQFYKHVDEVMPSPQQWYGKPLQLHGFVVEGSIQGRPDTFDYKFALKNGDSTVLASYTGLLPDTFKGGAEVVMTGHLEADGFHVQKDGITAKCPSKYQPVDGQAGK